MNAAALPDAEKLCAALLAHLRPHVNRDTGMVGIVTGGAWLAERLHRELGLATPLGTLDVSYYRDDFERTGLKKQVRPSQIPFDVQGRDIVLVDDVLYTGRTVRAAMNELFDYGRPARIDLAVLVDRGGRELPVAARYRGGEFAVPAGKVLMLERGESGALALRLADQRRPREGATPA
ncbi:MAG TPA: bifunctional pyr operon transcriptional regulator/uracil phosphoribosyltransferase PyrR [Burkholderiales bacterium]|nr:bifunctional pyr operon transcriptional regulator/uracil phosphoribosyltransferase PyrR [Burkholderiales bacterium]